MATSGSSDWTQVRDEIVTRALVDIRVVSEGDAPSEPHLKGGANTLNSLVKQLAIKGVRLWTVERVTQALVVGTDSFAPADADTVGIELAFVRDSAGTDYPVTLIDKFRYADISDKDNSGRPTHLWLEKLLSLTAHMYPVPDDATDVLHYDRVRLLEDFDTANNTGDFPVKWIEVLVMMLRAALSLRYGLPLQEQHMLRKDARELLEEAIKDDTEDSDDNFIQSSFPGEGYHG